MDTFVAASPADPVSATLFIALELSRSTWLALVLFTGVMVVAGETPFRDEAARRLAGAGLAWTYREVDPDVYGEELDQLGYARADRIALAVLTATRPH